MRLGLHALGIGNGARRDVIDAVARGAEEAGFGTLWAGEHVVMVDHPGSRYPYAPDGRIAVPANADWLDPMIALSFAAAATQSIRLATGVLLVPEHNPLILAKQTATLDQLSAGRFTLGIGVGWSREEFAALGIPFDGRGKRADEYLAVMRALWREDPTSFHGEHVSFSDVRVNPKPVRHGRVPVIIGGNSDVALSRVARLGDGWYGFNLHGVDDVRQQLRRLRELCNAADRDPGELDIAVALTPTEPDHLERLAELGVDELVLVDTPPADPGQADEWVRNLRTPV